MKYPDGYEYFYEYKGMLADYIKRKYPILVIDYNDLLENPAKTAEDIRNFIGCGRWDLAAKLVNKKQKTVGPVKKQLKDRTFETFLDSFYNSIRQGQVSEDLNKMIAAWDSKLIGDVNRINKEWEENPPKKGTVKDPAKTTKKAVKKSAKNKITRKSRSR